MEFEIISFIMVGFLAQMIDGALGMAYGVSANTFLLGLGISPAVASASVHTAEVVTTAISGTSHWKQGNIDKELIKRLAIPGVIGGAVGAFFLAKVPGNAIKPFVAVYLLLMGVRIVYKALKHNGIGNKLRTHLPFLGVVGGFSDAVGGGGWGPIVTSTLIVNGENPRMTIGSVNLTEFFVTFAEAVVFGLTLKALPWEAILGLIIGGAVAAPFGAMITKKVPAKKMMIVVGVLVVFLSLRTLYLALV